MERQEKLAVAVGSELNMRVEGMEEEFKSILIGMEAPDYLMVRMQIPTRFRNQIDSGTNFFARYIYLGSVYGFKTKSLGSVDKPYRLNFLSYPEKVESLNIRKAQRVSCFFPATLDLDKKELKGFVVEISKTGARFKINTDADITNNVRINDSLEISFPFIGIEGIHRFKGNIKSVTGDSNGISFGIQFEDVKPSVEKMIEDYVRDVLDLL